MLFSSSGSEDSDRPNSPNTNVSHFVPKSPFSHSSSFTNRLQKVTNRLKIATSIIPPKKQPDLNQEGWFDTGGLAHVEADADSDDVRVAIRGKRRTHLYIWSRRCVISNYWQFLSFVMTFLALFLVPIRDAWMDKPNDTWVNAVLFVSLVFFCVEMTLLSIAEKHYFNSFFFWLDFLGTVSLIFDIPWLVKVVAPEELGILPLLRGAKAARAGARATRLVRLVRLIRLVRFVKVLSFFNGSNLEEDMDDKHQPKPSKVGEILSEQISRRVVVLVLLVLFVAPQLTVNTDQLTPQRLLLKALRAMPHEIRQDFINDHYVTHTGSFKKVLYLEVEGIVYVDEPSKGIKHEYRPTEVFSLGINPSGDLKRELKSGRVFKGCPGDDDNDCTLVKFDDSTFATQDGQSNFLLILFMIFLLSFGSYLFTVIAKQLAVAPIERMLAVVDIVSESLHALKRDGDRYSKEEKDRTLEEELGDADEPEADYEISFLEEAVLKMAELLHMGFGAAGTEIIQRNLGISEGTMVETFIAGTKLNAVFAFCDIRKFTDTTEVLQENVLRFVNLVGHVVHSNTEWFEGSPNKNIGDAFLLVWKMTKMAQKRMNVQRQASGFPASPNSPNGTPTTIGTWAAPASPNTFLDDEQAFSTVRPSTRQRGDTSSLTQRLAPGVVEMMPTTTYVLFPEFASVRDESTAITLADGCLKAMVQTAFDFYHLNTIPKSDLLDQVIALDTVKEETHHTHAAESTRDPKRRRPNAWGKFNSSHRIHPLSTSMQAAANRVGQGLHSINLGSFHHHHHVEPGSPDSKPSRRTPAGHFPDGSGGGGEHELKNIGEGDEENDQGAAETEDPEIGIDDIRKLRDSRSSRGSDHDHGIEPVDGLVLSVSEAAFELRKAEFASRIVKTLLAAGRKIQLGYGMHFGWAIEGAIGSNLKIDASYLSPHVNTAARLEAATKQFGTMFLMSDEFVEQLSPKNQQLCRKIDNVILVGKSDPTALYTWDMWLGPPKKQGHMGCHPLSPLHILNSASASAAASKVTMVMPAAHLSPEMAPKMFVDMFGMGYRAYQVGSWDMAAKTLRRCLEIVPNDGPTLSLLAIIEKANYKAPVGWAGYRNLTEK